MGLDMYLTKRKENQKPDEATEVVYWRKANAILNWFDNNLESVANQPDSEYKGMCPRKGVQNLERYRVTRGELEKLVADCKKVLEGDRTAKSIPDDLKRVSGFFFGSETIDDEYWYDLKHTVQTLETELPKIDWETDIVEFYIWY